MEIPVKTKKEIEIMREGGRKLKKVFDEVLPEIRPGMSKKQIDKKAEELITKLSGQPSFKMVPKYHWATCITVNEEVVHGVPNDYVFKKGDIVSLDAGMYYKGFHTDRAETVFTSQESRSLPRHLRGGRMPARQLLCHQAMAGGDSSEVKHFLEAGKLALKRAIGAAVPGNRVGHISLAIQKTIEEAGFNVVRSLTGHGAGRKLHEDPQIPCFLKDKLEKTPILKEGMTLAIEVIYCTGKPDLVLRPDGWTVATKDGKISSLFEETIAITADGPLVLSNGA